MKTLRALYWIAVGVWAAFLFVIGLEAKREEGSSIPLAAPFAVIWLVGGLLLFLLLHILLRIVYPEERQ